MATMYYQDYAVESQEYYEIRGAIEPLRREVAVYYNISPEELTYDDYFEYARTQYSVVFVPLINDGVDQNNKIVFNGHLDFREGHYTIFYNISNLTTIERQRFTIMHELMHLWLHIGSGLEYCNEKDKEFQADIAASELFLPSKKLEAMLTQKYYFQWITQKTGMSKGALNTRLFNYLVFEKNVSLSATRTIVKEFRFNNDISLCYYVAYDTRIKKEFETSDFDEIDTLEKFLSILKQKFSDFVDNTYRLIQKLIYQEVLQVVPIF